MKPYYYFIDMFFVAVMLGYINHKYIKMQTTIAIMTSSLLFTVFIILFGHISLLSEIKPLIIGFTKDIDFYKLLMKGMLPYLLFAGSINIDLGELKSEKNIVGVLSILSTILSAVLIATIIYYIFNFIGQDLPYVYCLLFGSLISPTDPIAVLGVLKEFPYSKDLSVKLAGESLFNDGVGIVLFATFYALVQGNSDITLYSVISLFVIKAMGGVTWGIILGVVMYQLLKGIDDKKLEVLITLAFVTTGYSLAEQESISGPLAMVVSGIFIGNKSDIFGTSNKSNSYLITFWELIDEILNVMLFLFMGFEIIVIDYDVNSLAIVFTILTVLLARYITVAIPVIALNGFKLVKDNHINVLTWGGLRGGLAIALALALPNNHYKEIILSLTYSVVVFSVIIQGSTVKYLLPNK